MTPLPYRLRPFCAVWALAALSACGNSAGPSLPGFEALTSTEVVFSVTNPAESGAVREIHGDRIDPACQARSAVLLQHGLSYTGAAWDFLPNEGYSYARTIAAAGYTVFAIDRLGYGRSVLENGYNVNVDAYADMAHQIVLQLRGEFEHVALGGHSAGAEASEHSAGQFGGVDALIAMGYHHFPSQQIVNDFFTGDIPRSQMDDYEYFLGTPEHRAEMFYTENAGSAVVAADTAAAVLTPSGEIQSIGRQPSRSSVPQVTAPVFLQLADSDRLFEVQYADEEAALFSSAPSVTVDIVPQAGHTYMLHFSGPAAGQRIADWLKSLPQMPAC